MLDEIRINVIDGQVTQVETGVASALAGGSTAETILKEGLIAAMDEVGRRFEEGDLFVPEMLVSARAMQAGLQLLKPHLVQDEVRSVGQRHDPYVARWFPRRRRHTVDQGHGQHQHQHQQREPSSPAQRDAKLVEVWHPADSRPEIVSTPPSNSHRNCRIPL